MGIESGENPLKQLRHFLEFHRREVATVAVYSVAVGVLALATPVAVQALVSTAAFGTVLQPIFVIAALLLGGLVFAGVLRALKSFTMEVLQQRMFVNVTEQFTHRMRCAPASAAGPHPVHRYFYVFTAQKAASSLLLGGIDVVLATTVGTLVLAFYHPFLLVFDLALLVAIAGLVFLVGRGGVRTAIAESSAKLELSDQLADMHVRGFMSADGHAAVDALAQRYLQARRVHFRVVMRQIGGSVGLQAIASAALLGLGGWLVVERELTLGQLVAAELIVSAVLASLSDFGKYAETYYDLVSSLYKLHGLTGIPAPRQSAAEIDAPPAQLELSVERLVPTPRRARAVARNLLVALLAFAVMALFAPWQQSLPGVGRVIAYAPVERRQVLEAPVGGRVVRWFVQEGSRVKAGEPIVELIDNDAQLVGRLDLEREAVSTKLASYEARERSLELAVESARAMRRSELASAAAKLSAAESKLRSSEQKLEGVEAALETARLNEERTRFLANKGLASRRDLEVAELSLTKARTERDGARADVLASVGEREAARAMQDKARAEGDAKVQEAEAKLSSGRSDAADSRASLLRIDGTIARQHNQLVRAPRDAVVLSVIAAQGGDQVKQGDVLALLVPVTEANAVELWVDGNDAALISAGRHVRLQFEGWPAVQFTGWPSVAVGTFGGVVDFIDTHDDGKGNFRLVVRPDPSSEPWPPSRFLRQGARTKGWVLLEEVRIGYELWRRFNGFPPVVDPKVYDRGGPVAAGKEGA